MSVSLLLGPISLLHLTQRKRSAWLHNQLIWFSKFGLGTVFPNTVCDLMYHTVKFLLCFIGVLFHLFLLNCQILFLHFNSLSQWGCCLLFISWYNHFDTWDIVKFFFYILTVWANEAVVSCLSVGLIILIHGILLNCAYIVWFVFLYVYFLPSYTPMFSVTWVVENVRWQCVWHKHTNTVEGCAFLQTLSDIGCVHIVTCK